MTALLGVALVAWALRRALDPGGRRRGPAARLAATGRAGGPPPVDLAGPAVASWRGVAGGLRRGLERLGGGRAEVGLPEAVDALAGAAAAGRSVADGLELAARAAPPALAAELRGVLRATAQGLPLVVALDRWAAASEVDGAALVAAAVGLAGDAGGDVAVALAGVADTLRERRALGREIRALSAQARLSAATIAVAPLGFGAVAVAADGDTAGFLLGSTGGLACLAAGVLLDVAGFRWMWRLTAAVR